jgi:hypothetical protein
MAGCAQFLEGILGKGLEAAARGVAEVVFEHGDQ